MSRRFCFVTLLLGVFSLTACMGRGVEDEADDMLVMARMALRHGHYAEARDTILSLRHRFPTALNARRQGILLLDSIELQAATDSLQHVQGEEWKRLHIKQQFFERKLQEDKKKDGI